jgi:hypothetical protein
MQAIVLTGIGVFLVWQIITGSFAAYLALEAPERALELFASEPTALVTTADQRLNQAPRDGAEVKVIRDDNSASLQAADRLGAWAEMAFKAAAQRTQSENPGSPIRESPTSPTPSATPLTPSVRLQIRAQVEKALGRDPFNARALRLLGQLADVEGDEAKASAFMSAAARYSKRETVAIYWLMQKSLEKKDILATLRYVDTFLRTRPQLKAYAMPVLVQLAENKDPKAAVELKTLLATNPPWRANFFSALPASVSDARTPLDLMLSLKETSTPPTTADVDSYLQYLISRKLYELAYYTWLQFLPPEQLSTLGLLFNSSFEFPPSGLPFDWVISPGSGVTIDLIARPDKQNAHALSLEFGPGRVEFEGVSQLLMLPPGSYRFAGQYKGELEGRRGLQWRITCAAGDGAPLSESPMFLGAAPAWTDFSVAFTVPSADCRAQELRLALAARSASEQLVSGSIWFDELRVVHADQPAAHRVTPLQP